jgi:methyl-accepting chemotaxis protein
LREWWYFNLKILIIRKGITLKSLSIRFRILLPIIALIIIGMGAATWLSSRGTSNIVQDLIKNELTSSTVEVETQIDRWLATLQRDMQTLSKKSSFTTLIEYSDFTSDFYSLKAGITLNEFLELYSDYESAIFFDKDGLAIASSQEGVAGVFNGNENSVIKEMLEKAEQGHPSISKIHLSVTTGKPAFAVAVPMYYEGEFAGTLTAAVSLQEFSKTTIEKIQIGKEGYAFLTDQTGLIAVSKNKDQILKKNISDYGWGKHILSQKNGTFTYIENGVETLASFRTLENTGWVIVAVAATDDIFHPVNILTRNSLIISLIVVILLVIVIIFIVRPIVAAIKKGVDFAKEIQTGDLSHRLGLKRRDEIGELSRALDTMADGLQSRAALAEAIAAGDLTQMVSLTSDKDVLGRALSAMNERLNEVLGQIKTASEQIDSGSNQVSDSAQDLSQGATQQASAIEEIGASLSELSSRTKANADNAETANQLASGASHAANEGSQQMQQMVTAMEEINESGQNISKIIKTIDEIAFQTNLLALNAAVEAARAGQHGKGFAVVAEEVRNLAARSAKAATETTELIEKSIAKGENGASIANCTATALQEIVSGIGQTTDLVADIAAASREQADGLTQVSDGLTQVDQVVQRNTAGAEESAAAAEELSSQSAYMRQLIGQFKLKGQQLNSLANNAAKKPLRLGK